MAMSKTIPITNYFRKFNQSFQRKRPFSEDGSEDSRENVRRKSPLSSREDNQNLQPGSHIAQPSSQPSIQSSTEEEAESPSQLLPSSQPTPVMQGISVPRSHRYVATDHLKCRSPSLHPVLPHHDENLPSVRRPSQRSPTSAADDTIAGIGQLIKNPVSARKEGMSRNNAPFGSQAILANSQRIVRKGETMIRNSDDESDASLEDIDQRLNNGILSRGPSLGADTQLPSPYDVVEPEIRRTTRGSARAKSPPSQIVSTFTEMQKTYKFSLEVLVKQKKRDEASEDDVAKAKSMLHSYDQRKASAGGTKGILATKFIDSIMRDHGDEDDISKLKSAIQRTEALQHANFWSFLNNDPDTSSYQESEFPKIQDERLGRLFNDTLPRQQTFLSGFAGEYARKQGLPEEVLLWIMDAVCWESRDDLRYSYSSTLEQAREYLTPLLTAKCIDGLFQKLGATATALDIQSPVLPHATLSRSVKYTARPGLLSLLTLFGRLIGDLAKGSRIHLMNLLCRLALDHSLSKSCRAVSSIGDTMENLVESLTEDDFTHEIEAVMTSVYNTVSDSNLRLQILRMIPARSLQLIQLRQRLALACFFQDPRYLSKAADHVIDLKLILLRLKNPQFTITSGTKFDDLAACIGILSIGIDCIDLHSSGSKDAELTFNKDVDALASKINSMFNDIVDTGASDMKRTEAKEVLESFQRRLEYAVRTKPKPKKIMFGNTEIVPLQEKIKMQENMQEFLKNAKSHELLTTADGT